MVENKISIKGNSRKQGRKIPKKTAKKTANKTSSRKAFRKAPKKMQKRLYRSGREKILGGVCGGIAEYFNVDPVLIRLLWVILSLGWGTGIIAYIIAWIIIPENPDHKQD